MADVLIRHRTPHRIAQRQVFRGEVAGFRTLFCTTIRRSRAKPAVFCGFHAPASAKVSKLGLTACGNDPATRRYAPQSNVSAELRSPWLGRIALQSRRRV